MTETLPYIMLALFSIPTTITGLAVWQLKRAIEKAEAERKAAEIARDDYNVIIIDSVNASIALGEANAIAIINEKRNGETERALNYVREVKHRQKDFLTRKGVERIYNAH